VESPAYSRVTFFLFMETYCLIVSCVGQEFFLSTSPWLPITGGFRCAFWSLSLPEQKHSLHQTIPLGLSDLCMGPATCQRNNPPWRAGHRLGWICPLLLCSSWKPMVGMVTVLDTRGPHDHLWNHSRLYVNVPPRAGSLPDPPPFRQ